MAQPVQVPTKVGGRGREGFLWMHKIGLLKRHLVSPEYGLQEPVTVGAGGAPWQETKSVLCLQSWVFRPQVRPLLKKHLLLMKAWCSTSETSARSKNCFSKGTSWNCCSTLPVVPSCELSAWIIMRERMIIFILYLLTFLFFI